MPYDQITARSGTRGHHLYFARIATYRLVEGIAIPRVPGLAQRLRVCDLQARKTVIITHPEGVIALNFTETVFCGNKRMLS